MWDIKFHQSYGTKFSEEFLQDEFNQLPSELLWTEKVKDFVPTQWFSIQGNVEKQGHIFEARYYGEEKNKKQELLDEKIVDQILKDCKGKKLNVVEVKKRERKQNPTPPFTTSKLQQEAAHKLGFTAKKTMMIAQKLYEGIEVTGHSLQGLITYMRTDSVRTEPESLNAVREYIGSKYGKKYLSESPIEYKKKKSNSKSSRCSRSVGHTNLEFSPKTSKVT